MGGKSRKLIVLLVKFKDFHTNQKKMLICGVIKKTIYYEKKLLQNHCRCDFTVQRNYWLQKKQHYRRNS